MHLTLGAALLVLVALAFAWSMGAHYTGACMGMPYGSGSIRLQPALWLMAAMALGGAILASHRVETTVGRGIVAGPGMGVGAALVVVAVAFLLTTVYTYRRIPTSTIQLLVFSLVGAAVALGQRVEWGSILRLAILWVLAPPVAGLLGYAFTRLGDRVLPARGKGAGAGALQTAATVLVVVGAAASFTMGANDVSNATGPLIMSGVMGLWLAGAVGGIGLAVGVVTWGKPLLRTVAFDVVRVDLTMASAAQGVQALVVLVAVSLGYFTSMNQALVGAMAGAGVARGQDTVRWQTIAGIVRGWLVGPPSGFALAFGAMWALRSVGWS